MTSYNSWQNHRTSLVKNFPRSWQDLAKILLRYSWEVNWGTHADTPKQPNFSIKTTSEQKLLLL